MQTNNGKKGGLLKGKPHYDKSGKPTGGIKAVVTDSGQQVELEGGEVIINKEASKKHWKELSRINQSAGGGVPILPPDEDDGGDEFADGGRTIEFNPNHLPNRWVYQYAKNIKEKYPKVWDMGGNIFGNEAFKNLERALKRGYWTDSEKWMYIKWQSFNARHSGDIRIAGIIANLKWLNKVDKGWDYMKQLIEAEIDKKYGDKKMAKGGVVTYKNKYNAKYDYSKNESHNLKEIAKDTGKSIKGLQQIYNKGIGAYKNNPSSVRPNVKSKEQWAMARVYSAVMGGKASKVDANELKMAKGGNTNQRITCSNCGWTWNTKDSAEFDKYVCHNCGFDNSGFYAKGGELAKGIKVDAKELEKIKNEFSKLYPKLNWELKTESKTNYSPSSDVIYFNGDKFYPQRFIQVQNYAEYNDNIARKFGQYQLQIYLHPIINAYGEETADENPTISKYFDHYPSAKEIKKELQNKKSSWFDKMGKGGELAKGIKVEKEHSRTAEKLYNRKITPAQSFKEIAKDHLKEDSHYYTKLNKFESKMAKGGFIGLPSTDSKTWDAEYEVGDKVRIRKDFEANSPILTIKYVQTEKQMKRPENPKGKLYKLSNGQNWEGKDLEPADSSQVSGQTATQSKPQSNFVGTFMDNIDIIRQLITDGGTFKTTVDTSTVGFPRYFLIKPQTSGSDLVEIKCYEEDLQSSNIIIYPEHWVQWYIFKNIWVADSKELTGTSTPNQASKQKPTKQAKEPIVQYDYGAGLREFIINKLQDVEETTLEEQKHIIVSVFDKIKK